MGKYTSYSADLQSKYEISERLQLMTSISKGSLGEYSSGMCENVEWYSSSESQQLSSSISYSHVFYSKSGSFYRTESPMDDGSTSNDC